MNHNRLGASVPDLNSVIPRDVRDLENGDPNAADPDVTRCSGSSAARPAPEKLFPTRRKLALFSEANLLTSQQPYIRFGFLNSEVDGSGIPCQTHRTDRIRIHREKLTQFLRLSVYDVETAISVK